MEHEIGIGPPIQEQLHNIAVPGIIGLLYSAQVAATHVHSDIGPTVQ